MKIIKIDLQEELSYLAKIFPEYEKFYADEYFLTIYLDLFIEYCLHGDNEDFCYEEFIIETLMIPENIEKDYYTRISIFINDNFNYISDIINVANNDNINKAYLSNRLKFEINNKFNQIDVSYIGIESQLKEDVDYILTLENETILYIENLYHIKLSEDTIDALKIVGVIKNDE